MNTFSPHLSLTLIASLFLGSPALAEVVVIANPSASVGELDAKTVKKLFLGKVKSLPEMDTLTLVDQTDDSPTKVEFTKKATRKNLGKYKAYWSKMIFSGKAVPPKEMKGDTEVRTYVASHADAIGYINADYLDDSVKVLFRLP